jgi:hypothetical protein
MMANRPPRISVGIIVKALKDQIAALEKTPMDAPEKWANQWQARQLEEQIEALNYRPMLEDTAGWGGNWLGAVRSWQQNNFRNGSDVTWGSHETLNGVMTSSKIERLAAMVANEAIKEHMGLPSEKPSQS